MALDPETAKDLMKSFLADVIFIEADTAREIQSIREIEDREVYFIQSGAQMRAEDANLYRTGKILPSCAAMLGMTDLVYLNNHVIVEEPTSGVIYQSFSAGTSVVHGMCGTLRWRIIWDPSRPNCLIIEWFGVGESYWRMVDWGNNFFVRRSFQQVAHTLRYRREFRLDPAGFKDFDWYLMRQNSELWLKRRLSGLFTVQKTGQIANDLFRATGQFDAQATLDKQAAAALAKRIREQSWGLVPVYEDLTAAGKALKQAQSSETDSTGLRLLPDPSEIEGGNSVDPARETAQPGVYIGTSRVQTDMTSILSATPVACWESKHHDAVTGAISAGVNAKFDRSTLSQIQGAVETAADVVASAKPPPIMGTPVQFADADPSFALANEALVAESLFDNGLLDHALDLLQAKQAEAEVEIQKTIAAKGIGSHSDDSLTASIHQAVGSTLALSAFAEPTGVFSTALNTAVVQSQVAASRELDHVPDTTVAQRLVDDARSKVATAGTQREHVSAEVQLAVAQACLRDQKRLVDTLDSFQAKQASNLRQEEVAKAEFPSAVRTGAEEVLQDLEH